MTSKEVEVVKEEPEEPLVVEVEQHRLGKIRAWAPSRQSQAKASAEG